MSGSNSDWFVAADAPASGDGSRERPFHDLWQAVRRASPGDAIHVAAGTYWGRYDRSSWIVDCPNLTIRGGYSRDFSARAPWKTPSVFAMYAGYEAPRENDMITGRGDHSGLTLDGLCFDSTGANRYGEKAFDGIGSYPTMSGPIASFDGERVAIRNCVFVNGANGGVELSGSGSRFENNLLLNLIGLAMLDLRNSSTPIAQAIVVRNNSFCFMHDVGDPAGAGADSAIGIRIRCAADVAENLFLSCGNAAISVFAAPERVSIDRNLFFLTPRAIVRSHDRDSAGEITEKNLDELEDLGFKSAADNAVANPGIAGLRPEWLDAYSRHLLVHYVKPPCEAANAVRTAAGLPVLDPGGIETQGGTGQLAPRFAVPDALALAFSAQQGCHPVELAPEIAGSTAPSVLAYRPIEWSAIGTPDAALHNTRIELRVGLGGEQNVTLLPDASPDTHMGIEAYQPGSDDVSIRVLIPRSTLPAREYQDAVTYIRGMEVESTYRLRGVYRSDAQSPRQKVTIVVEGIVAGPPLVPEPSPRPTGRDWFVRAGASGGDGSREKPLRDPFQALEKAEGGDTIHVAAGDYFGKLHAGKWRIAIRNLALLGGYNSDFTERDPWTTPTRFLLQDDQKSAGRPEGTILGSDENSEGLILDGFLFDGASWNTYTANGSLNLDISPLAPLVNLRGSGAPIIVRNCTFLNGSANAIQISCFSGVFENNLVLNTSGASLVLRAEGSGPWTIRNNTILFAGDPTDRAGTGRSSSDGTLVHLSGRAVVHVASNVLAFADQFGVRASIAQQNLSFDTNHFAAILFNYLTDTQYLWADRSNWERRAVADSAFASFMGNRLDAEKLPVDSGFADVALPRLFGLPSRIAADDWSTIAAQLGASVRPDPPVAAAPPATTPAPAPAKSPALAGPPSLSDLMARLSHSDTQKKPAEEARKTESTKPIYCPAYDYKKALAAVNDQPDGAPGVRRAKLTVAFGAPSAARPQAAYAHVTPEQIDADRASLDNQAIELDVTEVRDSSTSPALFPPGMDKNNFAACTVAPIAGSTRTRLAIVVPFDTAAYKFLDRISSRDKIRVRGTAHAAPDWNSLSIVVDAATLIDS